LQTTSPIDAVIRRESQDEEQVNIKILREEEWRQSAQNSRAQWGRTFSASIYKGAQCSGRE